jgi:hypothetical protein
VIVAYQAASPKLTTTGATTSTVGGYYVHTFTANGTFVALSA